MLPRLHEPIGDEVKTTTCYMCACRCGIKVHLKDGKIRYIEGNRDHPVNRGKLCGKGAAGIMHHYSPARLKKPLRRVGERGSGEFKEIEWDEAIDVATAWLARIRATNPRLLAFFTGRDQSQALTGWWAKQFGTPNYAAHGGFCSVNMAAAGIYTIGSSFWEFSEPDWEHCRYFMMFGVAEDHSSNPIKIGIAKLKDRGARFVSVNPVRTGYSAVADEWIGVRPGRDGLFALSLIYELMRLRTIDVEYLCRYTNAPWLLVDAPGTDEDGLFARGPTGRPYVFDLDNQAVTAIDQRVDRPALHGHVTLPDGRRARPAFEPLAERLMDPRHAPDAVADEIDVPADTIRRIAQDLAHAAFSEEVVLDIPWTDCWGRHHTQVKGRPVSLHAMRGISAHSNGFHTCRILHVLQILLGSIDVPGGMLPKPPYPKSLGFLPRPSGHLEQVARNMPLPGPHLGFPTWPEHLLVDEDGTPQRIDKAFSWEAPLAAHGLMHAVITNAWKGDPYKIDTLFMYMANMAWNSAMNTTDTIAMLTDKDVRTGEYKIPRIIYSDAFASEMVAYADLVLPDTTYLERWDCISLLDRPICEPHAPADAIRQPVLAPDRDVRPFQDVLLDLGARLGLDGMIDDNGQARYPGGYKDYMVHHQRQPGIGSLAGWRGAQGDRSGKGDPNPDQIEAYVANGCFWIEEMAPELRYYRHANRAYLDYAVKMGFVNDTQPIAMNLYSEELQRFRLSARGQGDTLPPPSERARIEGYFDPLPLWYPPFEDQSSEPGAFPLHAVTQRPMAMYHSWGGQNAWLRQIHGHNLLYVHRDTAIELGVGDGDWVWLSSRHKRIKVRVKHSTGVHPGTVWTWNAIAKRKGAWALDKDAAEATQGFLLNHLIDDLLPANGADAERGNCDPVTGQAAWYDLRVRIDRLGPEETAGIDPDFDAIARPVGLDQATAALRYGAEFKRAK